jgi:hypothetical protein
LGNEGLLSALEAKALASSELRAMNKQQVSVLIVCQESPGMEEERMEWRK